MKFENRRHAGRLLAHQLSRYAHADNVIVLGIPRGGVPVAFEIAKELNAPLDIFLSRKLGVPGQEELAFGAIAAGDGRFLDKQVVEAAGITPEEIERITHDTAEKLQERALLYRNGRPPAPVEGRTVILVDDGIATGASIYAAICALREMKPKYLIVAVPVAPKSTCDWLCPYTDKLVALHTPAHFYAVGQFYREFSQVSDDEVVALLKEADSRFAHRTTAQDSPGNDHASSRSGHAHQGSSH